MDFIKEEIVTYKIMVFDTNKIHIGDKVLVRNKFYKNYIKGIVTDIDAEMIDVEVKKGITTWHILSHEILSGEIELSICDK